MLTECVIYLFNVAKKKSLVNRLEKIQIKLVKGRRMWVKNGLVAP